jgi:hypothetical protein
MLHEQAAMFSPGLNPAGIVVRNGLVATVGSNGPGRGQVDPP